VGQENGTATDEERRQEEVEKKNLQRKKNMREHKESMWMSRGKKLKWGQKFRTEREI
jgi:hypothetical protein